MTIDHQDPESSSRARTFASSAVRRYWGSLITAGWIDELRLSVHPVVLRRGKALFKSVEQRQRLALIEARPLKAALVSLLYTLR